MEKLWTIILLLLNKNKKHKNWTRLVLAAAGIVVFFTTYALILPALTLEEDTAEDMPGIFLEEDGFFDDAFEPENDWEAFADEPDLAAGIEDLPDEAGPGYEIPGESIWEIEGETEQITEEEDLLFGLEDAFPVDNMEDLPEDGFGPWLPEEDAEAYEEDAEAYEEDAEAYEEEYAEDYEEKYAEAYEEEDAEAYEEEYVEAFAEEYAETFAEEHEEEYVPVPAAETETETLEILEVILPRRNEEETNMNIYEQEEMFIDTQTEEAAETAVQAETEAATETVAEAEEATEAATETIAEAEEATEAATETVTEAETEEAAETVTETEAETEEAAETVTQGETEEAAETAADLETEEAVETVREAETEELLGTLSGSKTEAPAETETLMEAETESDQEILSCEVPVAGADYSLQIQYSAQAQIPEDAEFTASAVEQGEEYDRMGGLAIDTAAREEEVAARDLMLRGVFDLHITDADGRDLQPEEDLSICVRFGDERDAERDFYAVSFAGVQTKELPEEQAQEEELSVLPTVTDEGTAQFEAGSASTYAIVGTTLEKTVLASDGYNYKITVSFGENTGIPEDTLLQVQEIGQETADEYRSQAENALGWEEGSVGYARFFDISIVDAAEPNRQYQPAEGSTVDVQIELEDSDSDQLSVVHFAGEEALPEVMDTAASQGTISFETTGFSVYAVVDAPEPVASDGWNKVATLEEIAERGAEGVYIRHPNGFYFTNKQYNVNNTSRTGIRKTKPSASDPDKAREVSTVPPALYYFEPVSGTENQYKVYCFDDNGNRLYIRQSGNSLSLTTSANASAFTVSDFPGYADTFRMLGTGGYYWNMQGNDGGNGFAAWNSATDLNARMQLEYYLSQEDDPYGFNGKTYGLAFHNETATAAALTGRSTTVNQAAGLAAEDMNMKLDVLGHEGLLLVSQGSDITEWTLTNVSGDRYYLTTEIDGQTKYLTINGANVTLETEPGEGSVLTVKPGTGAYAGKVRFTAGDYSLCASQDKTAGTVKGFYAKKGSDEEIWLNFVEHSVLDDDDFTLYSAQKVSVSDTVNVYDTQQVIIYTRIWNDDAKRYEFYAVDHDGSLIRCYDTGDNIEWIGSRVNTALWNFTEYLDEATQQPNYYYELQNEQYGDYLAPQMTGGQILSDDTLGINLQGRKYGKNYTTIVAWDDVNYAYVGLKTENGRVVACPLSEAEDFYFAVVNPVDDQDQLSTVETVDGTQFGITMKMVDFNNPKEDNRDSVQDAFFGKIRPEQFTRGLLSTQLIGDYPETTQLTGTVQSLGNLFTGMQDVNHLFIQSIYNESGYFEYDSTSNFAHLNENGLFTVYDQLGTMGDYNRPTGTHGQFMPYNDLTPGTYASFTNRTDVLGQELSDMDPRKGEKLYNIGSTKTVDYFFGMEMSASFTQTASGLDAWGHDIIFEFSGDDDFWLYVDGELVLDLGGVRSALKGSVNFRTGTVINAGTTTTLYDVFRNNYQSRGMTEAQINEKLDEIFILNAEGNYVFRDYTNHTMKMFYMERGAGASNLHMRFNLAAVKPGTVMLSKKLSGTENPANDLIEFPYQIRYQTEADISGKYHLLGETTDDQYNVKFEGTNTPVPFKEQFTPAGGTQKYDNVFFLKPGQKAEIRLPDGTLNYYITECAVKPEVYDVVKANDIVLNSTGSGEGGRFDFPTAADSPQNRPEVEYDNHVSEGAMRTLLITKKLYAENGSDILEYPDVDTLFAFRLSLGTENADAQSLPLADMVPYFVKDTQGMYCRWNSKSRSFVSLGKADYSTLTDAEKRLASFTTSMNGAISKIPAGYTIEVRDLIVGTQYKAEERKNEIPKGYTLRLGDGYTRVDVQPERQNGTDPISGIIGVDEDPHIDVRNQKGWGLTVEKIWSDKDFMEIHDPVYFAVFYKNALEGPGDLIEGTVRQLKTTDTEVYYFFQHLEQGKQFSDYLVREVTLHAAPGQTISVKDDGTVEGYDPDTVVPIENGQTLTIGGKPFGGEYRDTGYTYSVSYRPGDQTIHNENVRTDIVTNSRPGIVLEKTDWNFTPLSGAVFTLKDAEGKDVAAASYKSGSSGRITIAYLSEGEYTLTEISAPKGYTAISDPIRIKVNSDETGDPVIGISGIEKDYYIIEPDETGTMAAVITIRNRSNGLQVKKIDEETNTPISGVHFALYRQVTGVDGIKRKDYLPMGGYENLVTDVNGILTQITMELNAGTYYLTETQAAENYELLSEDLCFTIGEDGTVSIETVAFKKWLQTHTDSSSGKMSFAITIPNRRSKKTAVRKVSAGTENVLKGAAFVLYRAEDYDDDLKQPKAGAQQLIQGSTDAQGMLQLDFLHNGEYRLVETQPPAGYLLPQTPVTIVVTADKVTAIQSGAPSEVTEKQGVWEITVWNNPGYVLPSTGGPGTSLFYISGILLAAIAISIRFLLARARSRII